MTNASTRKSAAAAKRSPLTLAGVGHGLQGWLIRNKFYIIAFFIPVALTYLAYALFGISPFGEESVLCLDLNGQYVYYFESLRDAFWGDGSIFYNWSRNLSGNFMGIIGYYLASPFTLIVMLLPEKWILASLLIMQLCKLGAAGVTFSYYLQKRREVSAPHALLFSSMYAMMAYAVIQLIDPMWLDGLVFLPLIIAGLECLVDDGRKINYAIPLAFMFVAHFYIGFMIAIFIVIYFIFYLFFGTDRKGRKAYDYFQTIGRMCYTTIAGLLCSAIMLLPMVYTLSQGKMEFTESVWTQLSNIFHGDGDKLQQLKELFTAQFELIDLIPQLLPAQYDSVNVQGSPEIYCGLLTVVLLPVFYISNQIKLRKKIGYTFVLVCMVVSMYFKPIDMMWHGGQSPNWLPYRYSFLISFVLLTMAAMAFTKLKSVKPGILGAVFFGWMVLLLVISKLGYEHIDTIKSIWVSIILIGIYCVCLYFMKGGTKEDLKRMSNVVVTVVMLFAVGSELTYNAVDSMKKIDDEVAYSTKKSWTNFIENGRAATDQLEENDSGLYRAEKTFYRCVNDNGALGLRGISHSSSVMNTDIINFIETMGYCMHSYYTRYDGNTPLADSLLGIKYVLNRESDSTNRKLNPTYVAKSDWDYNYTDENNVSQTIRTYENPNALSIGYMADADVERIDHLGNDNPFNSQNMLMSVISGNMEFDASGAISGSKNYYSPVELDGDPILSNVTTSAYGDQTCYTAGQSGDPTVDFHLTVATEDPIYIFFKTENQKSVNLWLGQWNDETSDYDFDWFNAYFEGDNYTIMRLGQFDIGTKLCLRMTVANEYTIVKNFFFYSFDEAMFQEDIDKMKENQWNITKFNDRKITGTITAEEGQVMMTSIPYEDGWTVKVDGKKVEPVKLLNALVGVPLEPGEHEVTMTFTPPGWNIGLICLAAGIVALILFYRYDKKHNAVLLAIAREKRQAADGKQPEPAKAVSAKPTTSTKSESEKTETTSKNAEKKESKPPTEEKPKESEAEDVADKKLDDSEQKTEDSDSKEEEATDSDSESK